MRVPVKCGYVGLEIRRPMLGGSPCPVKRQIQFAAELTERSNICSFSGTVASSIPRHVAFKSLVVQRDASTVKFPVLSAESQKLCTKW